MLDIAQSCIGQNSRMYKLQEKELIFYEAQPIELWSLIDQKSQKKNFCRILNRPKPWFEYSWKTFELLLKDLRESVPSNSTSIYRNKIYNQVLVESNYCIDQQALIWNLWVGSQSHKYGCLCATNLREKESMDLELARDRLSKLLLEVTIDLRLNLL